MSLTVADIVAAIADAFPSERAESWDRNGLLAGDPAAHVTGVHLALDPTLTAIAEAARSGANVLVTHHPAFLSVPERIVPGHGSAGVLHAALTARVALVNAHTPLDRAPRAQELLSEKLGLRTLRPLERSLMPTSLVTVWVPDAAAEAVTSAMLAAGAGRIGDYTGCSFSGSGEGRFTPATDAHPTVGASAVATTTPERRIELVCPTSVTRAVVAAAAAAHPYEEPLIAVADVTIARNAARMGMLCEPPAPTMLGELARHAGAAFGVSVRVWGDPDTPIERIATMTGSSGSVVGEVLAAGAQALVCGEVRYHDALDAKASGLGIIELGHDVSEWPLVGLLEATVRAFPGIDSVSVTVSDARPAWWTA